jgi:preprotein translocase subunit SecA
VLLSVMDRKWREHLYEMDYLQEGIGLRAMGQRDPLVEYQREGFDMFVAMMEAIKEESVGFLFNVEVKVDEQAAVAADVPTAAPVQALTATGPGESPGEVQVEQLEQDASTAQDAPAEGVAGSPVPSAAPVAEQDEPSLAVERPSAPAGVGGSTSSLSGSGAGLGGSTSAPPRPSTPVARTVLPEAFGRPEQPSRLQYTAPAVDGEAGRDGVAVTSGPTGPAGPSNGLPGHGAREQSRNSLCACGSGKKFKRCHGDPRNA